MKFGSIILAGGSSSRMGTPKPLIKIKGSTFLEIIYRKHRNAGIEKPIIVIPDFLEDAVKGLDLDNSHLVVCSPPEKTPLGSLKKGIAYLDSDVDYFILHPVDFPLPIEETIKRLMKACIDSKRAIIRPVHDGMGGHPILLSHSLKDEIMGASEEIGLREVVRRDRERVFSFPTDDQGVTKNINTWKDLEGL